MAKSKEKTNPKFTASILLKLWVEVDLTATTLDQAVFQAEALKIGELIKKKKDYVYNDFTHEIVAINRLDWEM